MDKSEICSKTGVKDGILMLLPARHDWYEAGNMCRRFGGRLHIDSDPGSVRSRTFPLVEAGENLRPERCARVWLGASDVEEEGVWRDSETHQVKGCCCLPAQIVFYVITIVLLYNIYCGKVLDLSEYWGPGQPNGVRVQNCAGVWELDGAGHKRYDDGNCDSESQCSICNFNFYPRATLRGICKVKFLKD